MDGLLQADRRTRHALRGRFGPYAMPSTTTGVVAHPCAPSMIERLQSGYELPESDDQLQAVVHLFQTLAPGHYRRLY